jgi:tetratricopeptide (TPR) repeat protein
VLRRIWVPSGLLDRAVALLEPDDPIRADLLVRLGTAATEAGDAERAATALDAAADASARSGDVRVEIRARRARFTLLFAFEPEGVTEEMKRAAEEAIPILEQLGDDEGLSIAWRRLCEVGLMWCRAADLEAAAERAAFHAERAGDRAGLRDAICWLVLVPSLGMTPPEAGIRRCRELQARVYGDRVVEAYANMIQGTCEAMLGRFEEGRAQQRRGAEILADLGMMVTLGGMSIGVGDLEVYAGDLAAAERMYREVIELLASIGEKAYLSTHAGRLAHVLSLQGRFDESEEMTRLAEETGASDDIPTQVIWRHVRAKLIAREGRLEEAVALAEEAVALTEGTDSWDIGSDALVELGEMYELAGRREDARRAIRDALDLYEQKGIVPVAERAGFEARHPRSRRRHMRSDRRPAHRCFHPSRSSTTDTPVPKTSDQKKGPNPKRDISERAIANAKSGPRTSGPRVISLRAPASAPTRANPASVSSSVGGMSTATSAATPAKSEMSRSAAAGTKTDR